MKINNFAEIRFRQGFTKMADYKMCQNVTIILDNFSVLDLVIRSTSHFKGHRRGGVYVLRMLLVYLYVYTTRYTKHYQHKTFYTMLLLSLLYGRIKVVIGREEHRQKTSERSLRLNTMAT